MDTNDSRRTILDLLDRVELELLQKDTAYARQFLQEEGLNIEEEQEYARLYMKRTLFRAQAEANRKQDVSLLERAFERIKLAVAENASQTSETLRTLLHAKAPSLQYRKLENWTDEEIRDVLADVDLIKLMEELDKD